MTNAVAKVEALHFAHRHLLTVEGLGASEINFLLDLADKAADDNRQAGKKRDLLRGRTLINLFFEIIDTHAIFVRNGGQAPRRRRHEHERLDFVGNKG